MKDNYGDKVLVGDLESSDTIYLYVSESVGSRKVTSSKGVATVSHAYSAAKARKLAAKLLAAADKIDPPAAIERVETNDGRFVPKVWLDGDIAASHYRSSGGRIVGPSAVRLLRLGVWYDEDGGVTAQSGQGAFVNRHYSLVERDGKPVAA